MLELAKDLQGLIGTLIGGAVAICGSYWAQRFALKANQSLELTKRNSEEHRVARAFRGEINAILGLSIRGGYLTQLSRIVDAMSTTTNVIQIFSPQARLWNFKVFETEVGKVGLLGGQLPEIILTFYGLWQSIPEEMKSIESSHLLFEKLPGDEYEALYSRHQHNLCEAHRRLLVNMQSAAKLGQEVMEIIDTKYPFS